MLKSMEERELQCPEARPLIGWRLFRVRWSESGFVLSAPLIHNPGFERFPSRTIKATCYGGGPPPPPPPGRPCLYPALGGAPRPLSGDPHRPAHTAEPTPHPPRALAGRAC